MVSSEGGRQVYDRDAWDAGNILPLHKGDGSIGTFSLQ